MKVNEINGAGYLATRNACAVAYCAGPRCLRLFCLLRLRTAAHFMYELGRTNLEANIQRNSHKKCASAFRKSWQNLAQILDFTLPPPGNNLAMGINQCVVIC
jgi:hypothetical protein